MSTNTSEPTVISGSDVCFVPSRMTNTFSDELTASQAACLVREFGECSECGSDIDPDVTNAVAIDRDVEWTGRTSDTLGRTPCDRSDTHTCEQCGTDLEIFVEEGARPALWSEVPDERWASRCLWIETDDGNFMVTNPGDIRISESPFSE